MGDTIRLSGPAFRPRLIEIDGGIISKSADPREIGSRMYFVQLLEEDGSRLVLWGGHHLGDAIRAAYWARRDFGIDAPVRDIFGGAA